MEIKLSKEDVMRAIQLWVNEKQISYDYQILDISKTRQKGFYLVAKIDGFEK